MKITDFVDKENKVYFSYYRQGYFWYAVKSLVDSELYCFPVPLSDIGTATLNHEDRAITFMRYIRTSIIDNTIHKEQCSV